MEPKYIVPSTGIDLAFTQHLLLAENKRILFSASFGSGKSFFLSNYFRGHEKFLMLKLHPIDYTVSNNEDIFEVIKHDLLIQIVEDFSSEIDLQKEDIEWMTAAKMWVDHKLDIFPFLGSLSKLSPEGEGVVEATNGLRMVFKGISSYKKELSINEEELLIRFLVREKMKAGSVREIDGMTGLINELLVRIKSAHPDKELVLVLDDMDRLDPEHIFRLFNIFSAHYESRTEVNKFGFDKVMFVCDIQNIEHIFIHKYGKNVDFEGYINKFYSREVFRFDFRRHLSDSLVNFFVYSMGGGKASELTISDKDYFFGKRTGFFSSVLQLLIDSLISIDAIKARNFTKLKAYEIPSEELLLSNGMVIRQRDYPFFVLISMLRQFFASLSDLQTAIKQLSDQFLSDYGPAKNGRVHHMTSIYLQLICWSIPFTVNDDVILPKLDDDGQVNFSTENEVGDTVQGTFRVARHEQQWLKLSIFNSSSKIGQIPTSHPCHKPNPFFYFYSAIEKARYQGLLRD